MTPILKNDSGLKNITTFWTVELQDNTLTQKIFALGTEHRIGLQLSFGDRQTAEAQFVTMEQAGSHAFPCILLTIQLPLTGHRFLELGRQIPFSSSPHSPR